MTALVESPATEGAHQPKPRWEVSDIFRQYGEDYRLRCQLPASHLRVMDDIEVCRTASLGGHIERCNTCDFERNAYNSCRNRHCPKCQMLTKARWLEARKAELLPVPYYHTVFTLPHELNPPVLSEAEGVVLGNKKVTLNLLFKAVSETLLTFGKDPKYLGGKLGLMAILHTWDQTLNSHFHLHCLVPAGALSFDGQQWIHARKNYLFPVKALSRMFRGKFIDFLQEAFHKGELSFPGQCALLGTSHGFSQMVKQVWGKDWVVYCKASFPGAEHALDYLGRYTHRVAISNHRITCVDNDRVTFTYRDRKDSNQKKAMTLEVNEFIRRFLLHVLPEGFMRIRYFGFLANRCKQANISQCRQLLKMNPQMPVLPKPSYQELFFQLTHLDLTRCPHCDQGTMMIVGRIPKMHSFWDTS